VFEADAVAGVRSLIRCLERCKAQRRHTRTYALRSKYYGAQSAQREQKKRHVERDLGRIGKHSGEGEQSGNVKKHTS
jgi:hypothetical protein